MQEDHRGAIRCSLAHAPEHEPADLADAIVEGGPALRTSTAAWFAENAERLGVRSTTRQVLAAYAAAVGS